MIDLFSKDRWFRNRDNYLVAARECRAALTNRDGYLSYPADDERVKAAVAFWVERARSAHAFAMGRRPIIPNVVVIEDGLMVRGSMHAA